LELEDTTKVYSVGYGLEDVKIEFSHDLKINVSGIQVEGKQGEIMNIPRWVAKTLHSDNHVVIHEQDMIQELKQAKVKEDVQGEDSISSLDKYFYIKLNEYMKNLSKDDFDKVESMLNQLIRIRQGKIIRLADSSQLTSNLGSKLSVEEEVFYNQIHNLSIEFKKQVIGNNK
jgi:DNA replication factor GINS